MTARIERILDKLAQRHAPQLISGGWNNLPGDNFTRIQTIARKLSSYDICVIVGHIPDDLMPMRDLHIQDWVRSYHQFYHLLAKSLFPSYTGFKAYFADNRVPPVVVLEGEANPVIGVLSGYVTPYLSIRQTQGTPTQLELQALMDEILTELAADDLSYEDYVTLREGGVNFIQQMLRATVQHISLTIFDKPILDRMTPIKLHQPSTPRPATIPEQERITGEYPAVKPDAASTERTAAGEQMINRELELLPEDDQPTPATSEMFLYNIVTQNKDGRKPSRPPLPDLPGSRNGGNKR